MPAKKSPEWTSAELDLLRQHYPDGGMVRCQDHLPQRSWRAIHQKAFRLGLKTTATNRAPRSKLQGDDLETAIALREDDGWSFGRIGAHFGIAESSANNAVMIALCTRKGFTPAQRDKNDRLTAEGLERLRYALKKGLKGIDIQLRLGVSASCVAEQRRRYNRDLKARNKAPLPPPGGGTAYSGVKLTRAQITIANGLFMQGLGTKKIHQRTGISQTSCTRIRNRLIKRLKRKGECLPGCDLDGNRHVVAESSAFIPDSCKQALREMLIERIPVRRAARSLAIGLSSAYRFRDELKAEMAASGRTLPAPILPGRVKHQSQSTHWPPQGPAAIYSFRELLAEMPFDQAKAKWLQDRQEIQRAERATPKSFAEQLEAVRQGKVSLAPAIPRRNLDTTLIPQTERMEA